VTETIQYVMDPTKPFPKRWRDKNGAIRVMSEPIEGYLMCRRPHCMPFVLSVKEILNAEPHRIHGPFELIK
jgi:hypothetical protein